jgi:hypothetical protein
MTRHDLTREAMVERWATQSPSLVDDARAHTFNENFEPGQWWINTSFAFRDGIIDRGSMDGGIVHNAESAFAIVLKDSVEDENPFNDTFTYIAKGHDPGRYRLTAATYKSRNPVRVLRCHNLLSAWSPRAGVRYDGL